ncbi:hypothetical protein ACP70R_042286 [Stipagrostis hirtigluma subsp. patula]
MVRLPAVAPPDSRPVASSWPCCPLPSAVHPAGGGLASADLPCALVQPWASNGSHKGTKNFV